MCHRLLIAGTHSGVGKTTLTVGLIAALRRRGKVVQPFKVGPDYIDPTYHSRAAERPCRNLDTWMVPPESVRSLFVRAARSVDVAIIEGVMGVYDGAGYEREQGSTAEVAKLLRTPVVLVLDVSKMARSAAALALGYQQFDPTLPLAGFLLNRTGSDRHAAGVAAALEKTTGLPVFGAVPRSEELKVPERHLGLVPAVESMTGVGFVDAAAEMVARHVDLEHLLLVASNASDLEVEDVPVLAEEYSPGKPRIAVARDEAFHFTYPENLELLQDAGADIAFFSPLRDAELPEGVSGLIVSGGFPEVYAAALSANVPMRKAVRGACRRGGPVYAECGGLMYLTESIIDLERREHPMTGVLPGRSVMSRQLSLGYRRARAATRSWLIPEGESVRGHEFHYSRWEGRPAGLPAAYVMERPEGGETWSEGACVENVWASYLHLHFAALPQLARRFVAACREVNGG